MTLIEVRLVLLRVGSWSAIRFSLTAGFPVDFTWPQDLS